jgi:hypothetical protein
MLFAINSKQFTIIITTMPAGIHRQAGSIGTLTTINTR